MNRTAVGQIVFSAGAVLLGVIALRWHDSETWQYLSAISSLPSGGWIGTILMIALIAASVGVLIRPLAQAAASILVFTYATFCAACVAGIVAAPRVFAQYGNFFEQFCLLCGALAAFAASGASASRT